MATKPPAPKKKPSSCSPPIFNKVIEKLSNGDSLSEICRQEWCCKRTTFLKYKEAEEDRRDRYTRARIEGTHAKVDRLHDIPDQEPDAQKARLKCDNIKWEASKIAPKLYGDRLDHVSSDRSMTPPNMIEIIVHGDGDGEES